MKLYEDKPNYVRLDDDVSFQLVRTNPILTTNTKLMYDGENLYMESYDAVPLLSTLRYKNHKVWKTGLFNRDIRNFLLGTNDAAYTIGQNVEDTIIPDSFDYQFENMYWCGVESINSDMYPQEMGCIAPLYLRKKRPNYFVIFKIDNPTNTNINDKDVTFKFEDDILKNLKIVKSFDLREGTPIGDYISRYVGQRDFKYDRSIYINFSSNEIYYYGIDKFSGVLTQKVENIEESMLNNDNTISKVDAWITSGFERNNLIFPYIINLEFLFDDKQTKEYEFARYFGMYCNDVDLFDLDVAHIYGNKITTDGSVENTILTSSNGISYIKDKKNDLYSIKSRTDLVGWYTVDGDIKEENFIGFEQSSTSIFAERLPDAGHSMQIFEVVNKFNDYDTIKIYGDSDNSGSYVSLLGEFIASNEDNLDAGTSRDKYFSCKGSKEDTAKAIASAIQNCTSDNLKWVSAFNIGNKVVIRAMYPGDIFDGAINVRFSEPSIKNKIRKITNSYAGGSDDGCVFKVYSDDESIFFDNINEETGNINDRDDSRYFKSGNGRNNAKIKAFLPYINENNEIDDTYSIVVTDSNGKYVNISKTEQVEIVDKFYAKIGLLSFFPVRDFNFDTLSSQYGNYDVMGKEIERLEKELNKNEYNVVAENRKHLELPYKRFYDVDTGVVVGTEYEYYFENILPELSTASKSVPFIAKWGYIDESKDSCENPYRLNTSKIFDTANFSANTFMQSTDIMEYTHSMPYYLVDRKYLVDDSDTYKDIRKNEYQYIPITDNNWNSIEDIKTYFSKKEYDPFDKFFGDISNTQFNNKRFSKKYSRFLLGDGIHKSSTLFRGVKFEITELDGGKEVNTGKYNDYRFAFVYVPKKNETKTIYFIKNDDFKFIVGIVFFQLDEDDVVEYGFNKAYVYGNGMGLIETDKGTETEVNPEPDEGESEPDEGESEPVENPAAAPARVVLNTYNYSESTSSNAVMRLYSNGTYRYMSSNAPETSYVQSADGQLFTGFADSLTVDVNGEESTYVFEDTEYIMNNGETVEVGYATIPVTDFTSFGDFNAVVNYTDGTTSSNSIVVSVPLYYDLDDGILRIYENGEYQIIGVPKNGSVWGDNAIWSDNNIWGAVPVQQTNSTQSISSNAPQATSVNGVWQDSAIWDDDNIWGIVPIQQGKIFNNVENKDVYIYINDQRYDVNQTMTINYGDSDSEFDTYKYVDISKTDFVQSENKMSVYYEENDSNIKNVDLIVVDSGIDISFKDEIKHITLNRSNSLNLEDQMPYGLDLTNYINIDFGDSSIAEYNPNLLKFVVNYEPGSQYSYSGNAVSIKGDKLDECTWEKNAHDVIKIVYGSKVYDSEIEIEIIEDNEDRTYIKDVQRVYADYIVGQSYTLSDFISFIPNDVDFSNLNLYVFEFYCDDSSKLRINKNNITPTSWEDFYNNYMTIDTIDSGDVHIYYKWKSYGSGTVSNGDFYINIKPIPGVWTPYSIWNDYAIWQ